MHPLLSSLKSFFLCLFQVFFIFKEIASYACSQSPVCLPLTSFSSPSPEADTLRNWYASFRGLFLYFCFNT